MQRHINMQFNGLIIAQTNINQEFGLAEYVPTKHWGDLLPFRIARALRSYHTRLQVPQSHFLGNAHLFDQVRHGSQSSHRTDPQHLKATSYTLPINTNTSSPGCCNHPASQTTHPPASKHRNITSFQVLPFLQKIWPLVKKSPKRLETTLSASSSHKVNNLSSPLWLSDGWLGNGIRNGYLQPFWTFIFLLTNVMKICCCRF